MTSTASPTCDLCGLPLGPSNHTATYDSRTLRYCCAGCKMVYSMLLEATDSPDPTAFKHSELYRRCVAAGVVPALDSDRAGPDDVAAAPDPPCKDQPSEAQMLSVQWSVTGMWCPACAWVIQTALERIEGVDTAACDFTTDRLRCRYDPTKIDPGGLVGGVRALGYDLDQTEAQGKQPVWRGAFVRLMVSALLAANVMMLSWALYSGFFTSLSLRDIRNISWPIVIMSTVVMVYGGGPLFRKAWWGLRSRAPGMEALVCLGAGSAYLYSLGNFVGGSYHLYFDTASMLITLVLLGKLLESRAKARLRRDMEGLLALRPRKVRVCDPNYPRGRFVSLERLSPGDRFRVAEGEMVPADGEVTEGRGWADASAVTGESRPRALKPGEAVTSGMRLLKGSVEAVARRVGSEALLGQMMDIVEQSLSQRTPLESRTDRWLTLFVPLMVAAATATTLSTHALGVSWEQAFVRGLTVLVVACPCALGIAVPLARVAGISLAGRRGILVRDFEAFERVRHLDCAVMDKTGTLTHGRWSLETVTVNGELTVEEVTALAACLEQESEHVIARAVREHARNAGIEPAPVTNIEVKANGVQAQLQGRPLKLGAQSFVNASPGERQSQNRTQAARSHIYMHLDGRLCATFTFADQVRASAAALVRALSADGVQCYLVSGDDHATTQAVARMVGIAPDNALGGRLPREKADLVARLQSEGRRVVMVGDGINDAPALARAYLSVAVHHADSLAQQAAAVTLMRGDPAQLTDFMLLARQVNAKVVQNLGCALSYNLISIPIAMSGLLNPLVAVTAMLLSSLTVIGNTWLLVRRR